MRRKWNENGTQDVPAENHIRCLLYNGCKSVSMALASIPKLKPKRDRDCWEGDRNGDGKREDPPRSWLSQAIPGPKAKQL